MTIIRRREFIAGLGVSLGAGLIAAPAIVRAEGQPMMIPTDKVESEYAGDGFRNYLEFLHSLDREAARQVTSASTINWVSNRYLHAGIQFILLNTAASISANSSMRRCCSN